MFKLFDVVHTNDASVSEVMQKEKERYEEHLRKKAELRSKIKSLEKDLKNADTPSKIKINKELSKLRKELKK